MKWVRINKKKLPQGEVLAANFKQGAYGYKEKVIGFLEYNEVEEWFNCESDHELLENCTHYIDLNKFDIEV